MRQSEKFMRRAIELAIKGYGKTRPNPAVGAVVVKSGKIVGEGWHRRAGGDHAEVAALKDAKKKHGADAVKGATVYCTLEPCSKPGRVGACCDALIAAGVRKVIWACEDPNPKNAGAAAEVLGKAGIKTEQGLLADEAGDLILDFRKHVLTGLPYVTVKIAMSLDGKICDDYGAARWISSADSRKFAGRLREVCDVIMVGAETVRCDNPSLLSHGKPNNNLYRAIISKSGRLPKKAKVFTDEAKGRTLVFDDGVKAIKELGRMGFMHVVCEGGLKLARSLAEAGLVDEWISFIAPKVIGSRRIADAICGSFNYSDVGMVSSDVYMSATFNTYKAKGEC